MKAKYLAIALGLLVISLVLVSACTCGTASTATSTATQTSTATSTATATATATQTQTATATATPTGNTLSSILGLGANITSVYYEMNITTSFGGGGSTIIQVWEKGKKSREQFDSDGNTMVIISDVEAGVTYTNISGTDWIKTTLDLTAIPEGAAEDPNAILDFNPEILGTETVDGHSCTVIQWSTDDGTIKEWIWTEKGFPVKVEFVTSAGTTTTLFTNIDFSDIPDSMFELPEGANVIEV